MNISKIEENRMSQYEPKRKKSGGRTKGTLNKTTAQIKDMIIGLVGTQMEKWPVVIDKMMKEDPAEAMKITGRLIDYVLPKQSKIDIEGELRHRVEKITIEIKNGNGTENNDN
jgi:hypothetical protein